LGCAKSTMFSIGGVNALKAHPFFEFIDWNALERLEIPPPFDFSVPAPVVPTLSGVGASAGAGSVAGGGSASKAPMGGAKGPALGSAVAEDAFALQFFDAEFTSQQLSLSMLEDTLNSQGHTPLRSGFTSRDESK
jgi:hypothetical protein